MTVSTICRGCGLHLKIKNGKACGPHQTRFDGFPTSAETAPFAKKQTLPDKTAEIIAEEKSSSDSHSKNSDDNVLDSTEAPSILLSPENLEPVKTPRFQSGLPQAKKSATAAPSLGDKIFASLGARGKAPRVISCFNCDHGHQVSALSTSSLCPKCGTYISLKNYDIKEAWNQRIQTRGDVTVHKQGVVKSATIRCHNLIIDGVFNGGADCSGDFTIRHHGKIMGRVTCRKLLVEKRAHVQFLNTIEAEEVVIDGVVIGSIHCKGKLALLKKATLTGNIHVGSLTVAEGAKHHGQISMGW